MKAGTTNDTIVALATPPGIGAIAVIRLSGTSAVSIADRIYRGRGPLASAAGYTVHHGYIVGRSGERIDEVLMSVFRAPHSYTGEDVVEISCHGGVVVASMILEAAGEAGARPAEPGEFTRRAFLNGRMDLSQAEAVMEIIGAQSRAAERSSLAQLEGRLSSRVGAMRRSLLDLCALLELDLDFAEEGLTVASGGEIRGRVREVRAQIEDLARTYKTGRVMRNGVGVVLVGLPNAGKSSLFNALLKESRAIVTAVPGTTRDMIEEAISIEGILFRLHDTAGLRESEDVAEREGVRRSLTAMKGADVVLFVVDPSDQPSELDVAALRERIAADQQVIWVMNKADLLAGGAMPVPRGRMPDEPVLMVSAREGKGIVELEQTLRRCSLSEQVNSEAILVTSQRHFQAMGKAIDDLACVESAVEEGYEMAAFDLRSAAEHLAEITGEVSSEEVLNTIFRQFCIGK